MIITNILQKIIIRGLVAVVLLCLSAGPAGAASLRVVTSFYPLYVAALNVTEGVEGVEVTNLASPHVGCLHDYQLTPADMRRLVEADVLLVNGAGMESFLDKVVRESPELKIVQVSEGIPLLEGNPHVWVGFEGAGCQVENIASALAKASPENAEAFRKNAAAYRAKMAALETRARQALAPCAGMPIVTFHEAFPYFARDFGLTVAGVIEREPGTEPGARELADMVILVRSKDVKALFTEPQFSDASAKVIARETGTRVYQLDPVVTGPSDPAQARDQWLVAMEKNVSVLVEALR